MKERERQKMGPVRTSAYFVVFIFWIGAIGGLDQVHGQASNKRQLCEGIVSFDADGMLQLMDTKENGSLWCDAYIGEDKNSPVAKQVLSQCPVGSRCIIEGLFSGRGVFYWTKIMSARQSRSQSMPSDLIGDYTFGSDEGCGTFSIWRNGLGSPEDLSCTVLRLKRTYGLQGENSSFAVTLLCQMDDPRKVILTGWLQLSKLYGRWVLGVSLHLPKKEQERFSYPPLQILARCG